MSVYFYLWWPRVFAVFMVEDIPGSCSWELLAESRRT